jgi:hypothetical protein
VAGSRAGRFFLAHAAPWQGRIDSGPNWSNAKHRPAKWLVTCSIRSSLASRSGSVDSFHVLVHWKAIPRARRIRRSRSRPTATGRSGRLAKYAASLRKLQCVNGSPSFPGRVLAATTISATSWSLIRRGRPPAHRGSSAARPLALNKWITSRTVSSSAATSRAIALTGVPDADAMMINARRTRIDPCFPRRTICCRRRPS